MIDEEDAAMRDAIADALLVLANVGYGDFEGRIQLHGDRESPLSALFAGINEMIDSLQSERQRTQAYQTELEEKLATIEQQRAAIRELSTPIIEVWDGIVCLTVVGIVDSVRSAQMTEELLRVINDKRTQYAILDITGIDVMDTKTVDHFVRMVKAVRLLGAECVLTGVSPNIASTMVDMGVDLTEVRTLRSLREALRLFILGARKKK
jgi:rsbT co-antagonist protein RsbR